MQYGKKGIQDFSRLELEMNVSLMKLLCVRARVSTLQGFKPSQENRWLLRSWGLSHDIFVSSV